MDSTKMLNIPSTVKDPNYRYKMPRIIATTQGAGGNIKTKLDNIKELAHALTVPMDYPLKFIGKELGSQTEIKNDVYLINGSHPVDKLQQILDKFIEKYVCCPKCKLPEIRIFIKKNEIRCKCRACGTISKLDDKNKFSNHIKNFPPKYDEEPVLPDVKKEGKEKAHDSKTTPSQQTNKATLDKETKVKIKSSIDKIAKLFENFDQNLRGVINSIDAILNEGKFFLEIKYLVIVNGVFDEKIYSQLKTRLPIIKHFIQSEEENTRQEATYHILGALADLTNNRFKNLGKYVSSILYHFYLEDIFTEDFWIKFAIKNNLPSYSSFLFTKDNEQKLYENSREFTNWIENAPYEDEEDRVMPANKNTISKETKNAELDDIDIDDI